VAGGDYMEKFSANGDFPSGRLPLVLHITYHIRRGRGLRRIGPDRIPIATAIIAIADRKEIELRKIGPKKAIVMM